MTPASGGDVLALTVLTGFLGSGKTTLLRHLLNHRDMDRTAVLVNEIGEVGLDHLLVREVSEDVVLLDSGCLCCNVRGDLVTAMRDLFLKRVRGDVPDFERLVIETTGLADPAPIIHTLMTDPLLGARYRFDGIVATVDAVHGVRTLDTHRESVKQVAMADRLALTKTDLADPDARAAVVARLRRLNPAAPVVAAPGGRAEPSALLGAGLFDPRTKTPDVARWLNEAAHAAAPPPHDHAPDDAHGHACHEHHAPHDDGVRSFVVSFDAPVAWDSLAQALDMLTATRGEHVLRIKGIVNTRESALPVVVHGVQHMFHPPATLRAWPDDDRRTRLVFVTRDLGRGAVEALLATALENG